MASEKKRKADAREYLQANHHATLLNPVATRITQIQEGAWTPTGHNQKVQLVTIAYAMLLLFGSDTAMLSGLAKPGIGRASKPDPARVFVEAIYYDELSTARELGKVLSRWAAAVRYLHHLKIRPSKVAALSNEEGQGIDTWAKAFAQLRQSKGTKPLANPATVSVQYRGQALKKWKVEDSVVLGSLIKKLNLVGVAVTAPPRATSQGPAKKPA